MRLLNRNSAFVKWVAYSSLFLWAAHWVHSSGSENQVSIKHEYFWDRNGVWNHTPVLDLVLSLSRKWKLAWEQEFDVVSGASRYIGADKIGTFTGSDPDEVSGASKVELRHSENPSLTYAHQGFSLSGSLYTSHEVDYASWAPSVSVSYEFNERNTTLGGSWSEFFDEFSPKGAFSEEGGEKRIRSLSLTMAQTLTSLTLVGLTVNHVKSTGYLGHPYNPPMNYLGVLMTESVPDQKVGIAVSAQIVQGFHTGEALNSFNLDMRSYADDWGIRSLTGDLKFNRYIGEATVLRLRGRFYQQTAADFALPYYSGNELYRTADIRHFAFSSWLAGIKFTSAFPEEWNEFGLLPDRWDVKYDHLIRDTSGDAVPTDPNAPRRITYQLYAPDENYAQGTLMVGLTFFLP
jgi:hypothetical protein